MAGTVYDGQYQQIVTKQARGDHRGWSPHKTTSRDKPAKPNHPAIRSFVTSGEIGTNAMHPPGKRSIGINKWQKVKAIPNRNTRADTAVRPYAEDLFR
jgi:hypothetical protein